MAIQLKQLTAGVPTKDTLPDPKSVSPAKFNSIPEKSIYYTVYTTPANRSAAVKGVRISNSGAATAQFSLYFNRPTTVAPICPQRRLLAPPNIQLPAGFLYIDDSEITLEAGDQIQIIADTANVIQYVISGLEKDIL